MYKSSIFTKETQGFIESVLSSGSSYSLVFTLAVARAIANQVSLPTSRVEEYENFYNTTNRLSVMDKVNILNELFVVNFPLVEEYVKKFCMQRYTVLYPNEFLIVKDDKSGILDCFSIRRFFSEEALKTMQEQGKLLMVYTNEITKILTALTSHAANVAQLSQPVDLKG